jgi:hypothetical protein
MLRHGASLNEIGELLRRQARANSLAPVGPVVARRGPMNTLCQAVDDYLELRRGLGFKLVKYGACLREFVSFLGAEKNFPDHDCFGAAVRDAPSPARRGFLSEDHHRPALRLALSKYPNLKQLS